MTGAEQTTRALFSSVGVTIDGANPWDIQVHDERLYSRALSSGTLGLGEAYMDGWWDSPALDQMTDRALRGNLTDAVKRSWPAIANVMIAKMANLQTPSRAFQIGEAHYDAGNDLYQAMLDKRLVYTCGYWKSAASLDESQEAKLDLVCRKIGLQKGQRVLDIGCGWGSFAKFAAERYGANVVGITVSKNQLELGKKNCEGLPVELRFQDYRDVNESFDHIISLGMFEHVGVKNYRQYFEVARRCLKDDGLFLLHTIGASRTSVGTDPWIDRYIFPNSHVPGASEIARAADGLFVMEDWHNFSADYDKTLMAWHANFEAGWSRLATHYDERFHRMWRYYLLTCAGSFRARKNQLWQIVFSKNGVAGGYQSMR